MIKLLIICPLVFLAGFIDAVAGGGGLISLPAYILAGFPTHSAVATNKLSSAMGTSVTTYRYWKNGYFTIRKNIFCIACAFIGSACGARIALLVDDYYFKLLMLVVLPIAAFYVLKKKDFTAKEEYSALTTTLLCCGVALVVGAYDGFYGPGTGTFMILLLTGIAHMDITKANGTTKAMNLTTNYAALIVYLVNGQVVLLTGFIAGFFGIAGNYLGSRYFEKNGGRSVKLPMLIVLSVFFVKVTYELCFGS